MLLTSDVIVTHPEIAHSITGNCKTRVSKIYWLARGIDLSLCAAPLAGYAETHWTKLDEGCDFLRSFP